MTRRGNDVSRLLDRQGRLARMPARDARQAALAYLASKFEHGRDYSEREVNEVLDAWHTFGDHTRLRRDLCDAGLLAREPDGRRYWRVGMSSGSTGS
jgi:hypothetical protein